MSQSTNIEYNRTGQNLLFFDDYKGPLRNGDYIRFKSYQLGNTIVNTVPTLNELVPPNKIDIFDINRSTSTCPQYDCTSNTPLIQQPYALTIPVIVPPNKSVATGVLTNVTQPLTPDQAEEQRHPTNTPLFDVCKYKLNFVRKKPLFTTNGVC